MGSDESHFNVSLTVRNKVTRQCPQTTTFWSERTAEANSNRCPSAYQPNALPLGQTGSHHSGFDTCVRLIRSPTTVFFPRRQQANGAGEQTGYLHGHRRGALGPTCFAKTTMLMRLVTTPTKTTGGRMPTLMTVSMVSDVCLSIRLSGLSQGLNPACSICTKLKFF